MSISFGHRALFSAFGHRNLSAPQAMVPASARAAEAPATVESGELTCSPWEGLYLDQARPVTAAEPGTITHQQLDSFLASLMYGE